MKGLFEVALGVLVLQVEELQDEGVLHLLAGEGDILWTLPLPARQHGGPVLREGGSLVELRADLPVDLPDRPPASERLGLVEPAGALVPDGQEAHIGGPGQRKGREKVVEAHLGGWAVEFSRRRLENLSSVGWSRSSRQCLENLLGRI